MTQEQQYLARHSAHDFEAVMQRWEEVAEAAALKKTVLSEDQGGFPVVAFETQITPDSETGVYLCAGVHGDEPAGVLALLEWAEENVDSLLNSMGAVIFPCFNPSGLVANTRHDSDGRDLNRLFQERELPLFKAWHEFVGGRRFRLALHFHEDYDARGIYMYELSDEEEPFGEPVMQGCESVIPREVRTEIDGSEFENAILTGTRKDIVDRVEEQLGGGYPEAIYVFLKYAECAITFETPSEFSLWERVQSQRKFIEESLQLGLKHP